VVGVAVQDYLKTIYKVSQESDRVTPSQVAEQLEVSQPAVTKMVRRLQELNLCDYSRDGGLELREAGRKIALEMIRHHRLLELYLKEALGFSWDRVHEEAERLEHVISEEFEERIDRLLQFPTHDPHGDPIPTREGHVETPEHATLEQLEPGDEAVVARVSDEDPEMLRYLEKMGLFPGTPLTLIEKEPYGGSLHVRIDGERHGIGRELAARIFLSTRKATG
jgi:DtxR family Mn-dependent transcriptional regulator